MQLPDEVPAYVSKNFSSQSSAPAPVVTVILFDALDTRLDDQRFARKQILKFLEQLKPEDRVGLYVLGARLRILHDFTSDASSLLKEMARFGGDPLSSPSTESSFGAFLNDAKLQEILTDSDASERANERIFTDQVIAVDKLTNRIEKTLGALDAIAQHLSPVSGRKNFLWVSAAFPTVVSSDVRTATGSPETLPIYRIEPRGASQMQGSQFIQSRPVA